jgi:phospholipid/cholesterol/gamma-HCH transport system substrate-binding protein
VTAIRKHLKDFIAVIGLIVIAAGVSAYILSNQRMRFPIIQDKPYVLQAEFQTAQAVIAGQGQTVRVAGVQIGDIGDVELKDGRAIVRMDILPKYKDMIHTDATALLRPKTGLKDMFIQIDPGTDDAPVAKENWTIPVDSTQPDVNPDEILSSLDADTRDYLRLLISDLGRGLKGRNGDLRDLFRRFEPTHRDLARVNGAIAERRTNLRRLITSLNELNGELASHDDDIAGLVTASSAVLRSFASEEQNISSAVAELPSTLRQTTASLGQVQRFADVLGPTTERLRPAARALDPANRAVIPFAKEATPLLADDIRPFVKEARPLVRDLRPASVQLADAAPGLTRTFKQLNNFFNLLAYNPNGREGPEDAERSQEGYLFWLAWAQHMAIQLFSTSDANGVFRPVTLAAPCATIEQTIKDQPEIEFLSMLTPLLTESQACATE